MRVGLNAEPKELPAAAATFAGMRSCRVFGAAGKGIPAWTTPAMTALHEAGITAWPSFKDWTSDDLARTAVTAWLNTLPADVPEVWLTYHHEPEADLSSYEYRRRWRVLHTAVRAHRNSARVKLIPIHTLYPARHKIGDRWNTDWTRWTGIWQQWTPTRADGAYLGDAMGWDCYLETTARAYEDPDSFFRIPIAAAYQMDTPLVIPELGALRVNGDTTGTGRAQWINHCVEHLAANGVHAVNWWHATGTAGQDYRLTDTPSADAWRQAIATYRVTD